ncbi:MAG TPA: HEPN domain-containing protein [bacterium]|nr:HEPN domain-containing protein [bacterium]
MVTKKIREKPSSEVKKAGKKVKPESKGDISVAVISSTCKKRKEESLSAFDIFQKTIKRAKNLIETHEEGQDCTEQHFDCFRAAIVLSISALDAYVRTLVVDKILACLEEKVLSAKLKEYIKGLLNQDALIEAGRKYEFRERVEKAIRADFETKAFQGEYKINSYMELVGYKDVFEDVSRSADRNKTKMRADIERFTKRRHVIAHCGDFDLNQTLHKENTIKKEQAKECISMVTLFAEHLDKITSAGPKE